MAAPFTFRTRASFFSMKVARRSRIVSRIPPASPAATMFTYSSLNALGCLRRASASVCPLSTSYTTAFVTSLSFLFSVCSERMSRACTSGSPELIIVANWRVKMTMSRVAIPEPKESLISFGACWTFTTIIRFLRRCATTSSCVGRSSWPDCSSPVRVRAV
jgi:hypothetical protein